MSNFVRISDRFINLDQVVVVRFFEREGGEIAVLYMDSLGRMSELSSVDSSALLEVLDEIAIAPCDACDSPDETA